MDTEIRKDTQAKSIDTVQMRHSPVSFIEFVAELKLGGEANVRKIKTIVDIGFGGFLEFDFNRFNSDWAAQLLLSYNSDTSNITLPNGDRVHISDNDAYCVYGVPKGSREIKLYGNLEEDEKYNDLMGKLRNYWNVSKDSTSLSDMIRILRHNNVDDDGMWIRSFIVLVVNCFIQSTTSTNLYFRFLYSILDIADIKEIDWGKMTKNSLMYSASKWKDNRKSRFIGPLHFLMYCYFDRVVKEQMRDVPRTMPITSVWTSERIRKRFQLETKSGFGVGNVVSPLVFAPQDSEKSNRNETQAEDGDNSTEAYSLIQEKGLDNSEYFYKDGLQSICRMDMQTIKPEEYIGSVFVDAFSVHLNSMNKNRAIGSPNRLFFTTNPFVLLGLPHPHESVESRAKIIQTDFNTQLDKELEFLKIDDLKDYDMFFFPIVASEHYYVICVNCVKKSIELLDNRHIQPYTDFEHKYRDYDKRIRDSFASYLLNRGYTNKSNSVSGFETCLLLLPWKDNSNVFDCALFCMKHMEEYKSQPLSKWDFKFDIHKNGNPEKYRIEYALVILFSNSNILRHQLGKKAEEYFKSKESEEKINQNGNKVQGSDEGNAKIVKVEGQKKRTIVFKRQGRSIRAKK